MEKNEKVSLENKKDMILIFVARTTTIEKSWNCEEKWKIYYDNVRRSVGSDEIFLTIIFMRWSRNKNKNKLSDGEKGQCIRLTD